MARINYNKTNTFGAIVAGNTAMLIQARENFNRIKQIMDSMVGFPVDYSKLEVPFGLDIGTGQAFYNTVVGYLSQLNNTIGLADLDQG